MQHRGLKGIQLLDFKIDIALLSATSAFLRISTDSSFLPHLVGWNDRNGQLVTYEPLKTFTATLADVKEK